MRGFSVLWLGQAVSILGTGMTGFAMTIWAWQETGQATTLALVALFNFGPSVLLAPVAGALADRLNRKLVIALSDTAAGIATASLLTLHLTGALEIWHLYALGAWSGAFSAFQFPAFSAAISTMLPKEQYVRASGMMSMAESGAQIAAPLLAAVFLATIGLAGVLVIDILSCVIAVLSLLLIAIPRPAVSAAGRASRGGIWPELSFGFRYILQRSGLLSLLLFFAAVNLIFTLGPVATSTMILARTAQDAVALGTVQTALGVGGLAGGVLLSVWGGPKRRVYGVLGGTLAMAVLGVIPFGLSNSLPLWLVFGFATVIFLPILNGCSQAIWQAKVPPDVQGKVFSARRVIAQLTGPLSLVVVGPLLDKVLEPGMRPGGALAALFGPLFGTGPGSGAALMLSFTGVVLVMIVVVSFLNPNLRNVETDLPDHDAPG